MVVARAFSIGRAISVNSNRAFGADTWDDVTFMWFDLEKSFLFSDGSAFATAITAMDRKIFDGDLSQIVGGRLPQGLAEMAINAHQTRYCRAVSVLSVTSRHHLFVFNGVCRPVERSGNAGAPKRRATYTG